MVRGFSRELVRLMAVAVFLLRRMDMVLPLLGYCDGFMVPDDSLSSWLMESWTFFLFFGSVMLHLGWMTTGWICAAVVLGLAAK